MAEVRGTIVFLLPDSVPLLCYYWLLANNFILRSIFFTHFRSREYGGWDRRVGWVGDPSAPSLRGLFLSWMVVGFYYCMMMKVMSLSELTY